MMMMLMMTMVVFGVHHHNAKKNTTKKPYHKVRSSRDLAIVRGSSDVLCSIAIW